MPNNPVRLEVYKHLFAAIAEEMGAVLRKSSYSPNIKERRDYSCAIFDPGGRMVAQAAHIPVHLGAMPLSVAAAIRRFSSPGSDPGAGLGPGDVVLLNDPFQGGTHLPDITLVHPVFVREDGGTGGSGWTGRLVGFAASRAHHADVGGAVPGSMALAHEIYQEGLVLPPVRLVTAGELNDGVWDLILANVRTPQERAGDLRAQLACGRQGVAQLQELVRRNGFQEVADYMAALIEYSARMTRLLISGLRDGVYRFEDRLDDDGTGSQSVPIAVEVQIQGERARVDFSGTAPQQSSGVNAVYAITQSAVFYAFRCLVPLDIPNNSGCLEPIDIVAPEGTLVNARHPAPVAAGNVETSQRIVDVLLGALAQASPGQVPAASQGSMNNLTIGGWDPGRGRPFTYYETIGGGMGARPDGAGHSGLHSHMTNTLNTPAEALEYAYPLRVERYELRRSSGGAGRYAGGDGLRRDVRVLVPAQVSLLTERRRFPPYGLAGGHPGRVGRHLLIRDGEELPLPAKGTFDVQAGDVVSLRTPGGGGFGEP